MRITCNQCGKNIQSESCKKHCNEKKRWAQFEEAHRVAKFHRDNERFCDTGIPTGLEYL